MTTPEFYCNNVSGMCPPYQILNPRWRCYNPPPLAKFVTITSILFSSKMTVDTDARVVKQLEYYFGDKNLPQVSL